VPIWISRLISILITTSVATFALATSATSKPLNIDVSEYTLENGMKVVVIPDHRAPVVTHMVWYKVGAADEENGKSGLAHFLEHLLFKGTKKIASGEFSKIIARNGGKDNAFTHYDYTAYFQRISKDRLEMVMEMEADRMQNLQLGEKDVVTELKVVQEERRTRTDNKPSKLLTEQMTAAQYLAHPYGIPIIGWMSEVEKLTLDDAVAFYKKYYTPSNAILVVAGDVTGKEVLAHAKKHYATLKNTATPAPRQRTAEPTAIAARRVILRDKRVSSPYVVKSFLAPSYKTADKDEAESLEIFAQILGGGSSGRLYRQLVIKEKIAVSTGVWYTGSNMDSGSLGFYVVPAPGKTLQEAEKRLDSIIADVLKNGVTEKEVDRARTILQAGTIYTLDSQRALANAFGRALVIGRSVDDILNWSDRFDAVTNNKITTAIGKVLTTPNSVTGLLMKPEKMSKAEAK